MFRALLLVVVVCLAVLACGPGGSGAIGALSPEPYVAKPSGLTDSEVSVVIEPGVRDTFQMKSTSMRPLDVIDYRSSVGNAMRNGLSTSFQRVNIGQAASSGLTVRAFRFEPKHIKVGNTTLPGSATVYDMQCLIEYDAALLRAGKEIARANGRAHGDDVSWKADDAPHVLNSALEVATTQMLEELLASAVPAQ